MRGQIAGLRADFRPERADSRLERADFRPERVDFRPDRADFRPDRADFRPERAWGRRMDGWTDGRMDGRKSPCVLQDFIPCGATAQKNTHNSKILWTERGTTDGGTDEPTRQGVE